MKTILKWALLGVIGWICSCGKDMGVPGVLVPKTVMENSGLPAIQVNGARLHAEAHGPEDSTLVICIHGGPGADYRYMLTAKALTQHGYRVIFYDQRGSGLSQRFSYDHYVDQGLGALDEMYLDLRGVINHYKKQPQQKVVLLGHSWGGMLATAFTGKNKDLVDQLIVCEPGGLKWADVVDYQKRVVDYPLISEFTSDGLYQDRILSTKEEDEHEWLDYKTALFATEKLKTTGDDATAPEGFWRYGAVNSKAMQTLGFDFEPDLSAGISQYREEVLFLYSSQSIAYGEAWARKIGSVFPKVKFQKFTGTHSSMFDKDIWVRETEPILLNFLK